MTSTATEILDGGQSGEELLAAFRRGQARTALDERLVAHSLDLFDGEGRNSEVERFLAAADALRGRVSTQMATEMVRRREGAEAERKRRFGELQEAARPQTGRDELS